MYANNGYEQHNVLIEIPVSHQILITNKEDFKPEELQYSARDIIMKLDLNHKIDSLCFPKFDEMEAKGINMTPENVIEVIRKAVSPEVDRFNENAKVDFIEEFYAYLDAIDFVLLDSDYNMIDSNNVSIGGQKFLDNFIEDLISINLLEEEGYTEVGIFLVNITIWKKDRPICYIRPQDLK